MSNKFGPSVIQILVGAAEETHTVHRDRITRSSDFFAKALNGNFKEKEEGLVRLPEQNSKHFSLYVEWLYSGAVFSESENGDEREMLEQEVDSEEWSLLLDLHILGDAIQDIAFQNTVVDDAFVERIEAANQVPTGIVERGFKTLPPASPLRELLVDVFINYHAWNLLVKPNSYYPRGFLLALSVELMEKLTEVLADPRKKTHVEKPWRADPCRYHVHLEGSAKCQKAK